MKSVIIALIDRLGDKSKREKLSFMRVAGKLEVNAVLFCFARLGRTVPKKNGWDCGIRTDFLKNFIYVF